MSADPSQILILGGGFAGVYTARYLEKLLRPEEASITLINRENYWVYQPMLPEVISGSIGLTNVVSPIRRLCRRTNLIMREVEDIDLKRQIVTISPGFRPRQRQLQLQYDHVVIALGSITNFHGMPDMIENAMPFRSLADAMVLRNHLVHVLEEADVEENPELRRVCHGAQGQSGIENVPSLGAQPAPYPVIQLFMFREKIRLADPMNEMTKELSDNDLQSIADFVANQAAPQPPADLGEPMRREGARALVEQNHCNVCHRADFAGRGNVPRLADQREDYLLKSLRKYKSGARRGYDTSMAEVLQPVDDMQLIELAYYLARLR